MSLKFFDANCYIGRNTIGSYMPTVITEEHICAMDEAGVERALLWHIAQYDGSPENGNKLLADLIKGQERLYGCWTILPPQTHELYEKEIFFSKMKEYRIYALRAFPLKHRYILNKLVFGEFLNEIVQRKIPLILSMQRSVDNWQTVYNLLAEYPSLTCIISDTGVWGTDRYFRPLLENYTNLHIESSFLSMNDGVIEDVVRNYGSERIVFGSGFPDRVPFASMLQLKHADIGEEHKQNIASHNMERLLAEVLL